MRTLFLFVGQGSQSPGMGADLAAACADCRATFETADRALNYPLSQVMAAGPEETLRRTAIAQPAILTLSVAHARHLIAEGVTPDLLIGHSLGQYSALVIAGALDFEHAVRLVAERGRLMQETVPEGKGAMAAIVGLDREIVYQACDTARSVGIVNVACHNAPGQTVISGEQQAVAAACEYCEEEGGGAVPLPVSAPFHCDLLLPMVPAFQRLVEATPVQDPALPVLDNVTAEPLRDAAAVRRSLVEQLTRPVLFEESLRSVEAHEEDRCIQCGPGKSLLSFARRILPKVRLATFEEMARAVEGV